MKIFIISRGIPTEKFPLNGIFEFDQAKALSAENINVTMLVIDFRSRTYKRKYGCFHYVKDKVNVFELSLPLGIYRKALPLLQCCLTFLYNKAVKKLGKPDVIHTHFYFIAAISSCLKKKKIPFVITEHSSKLNKNIKEISALDQNLARKAYQGATTIIAVSKELSQRLENNFNVNTVVINNMIDCECFTFCKRLPKKDFTFISVGNLVSSKGFQVLIEAFSKSFDIQEDIYLNIIGAGEEKESMKQLILDNGRSRQIQLLGQKNREDIGNLMCNSDAFVLASFSETFGISYVEAMMSGLPVIATRCGGPESFVNDSNGILINPNDVDALSKALIFMYKNAKYYDSFSISEQSKANFSSHNIAEKLIKLYQSMEDKKI